MAERIPPFRILSLAGGGYLGLFTAQFLAGLEHRCGAPLGRQFDLIAGTSVGGILALALAFEIPMRAVVDMFLSRGSAIFTARSLPSGQVGRLLDLTRSAFGPKHDGRVLREALAQHLAQLRLKDALHAVVVPAVEVTRSRTKVFKTPHAKRSSGDEDVLALDVAMATSAAPAYFPSVEIDGRLYADGGLFAVAPDQVAMHEAAHFFQVEPERIRMLSVGTATRGYHPSEPAEADDGAIGWLSDGRLIMTLVSVQQQHVEAMMEDRLGDRYMRIDAPWPLGRGLGIDIANPKAAQVLGELAAAQLQQLDRRELKRRLGLSLKS